MLWCAVRTHILKRFTRSCRIIQYIRYIGVFYTIVGRRVTFSFVCFLNEKKTRVPRYRQQLLVGRQVHTTVHYIIYYGIWSKQHSIYLQGIGCRAITIIYNIYTHTHVGTHITILCICISIVYDFNGHVFPLYILYVYQHILYIHIYIYTPEQLAVVMSKLL